MGENSEQQTPPSADLSREISQSFSRNSQGDGEAGHKREMASKLHAAGKRISQLVSEIDRGIVETAEYFGGTRDPNGWRLYAWNAETTGRDDIIDPDSIGRRESVQINEPEPDGQIWFYIKPGENSGTLRFVLPKMEELEVGVVTDIDNGNIIINEQDLEDHQDVLEPVESFLAGLEEGKYHQRIIGATGGSNMPSLTKYSGTPNKES